MIINMVDELGSRTAKLHQQGFCKKVAQESPMASAALQH
jgi:hypothetical protein